MEKETPRTARQQLMEIDLPSWEKAQAEMMSRLGPAQWDALHADLRNLVARVP